MIVVRVSNRHTAYFAGTCVWGVDICWPWQPIYPRDAVTCEVFAPKREGA